jgi:selenocysteine lyase/cysteine desulfurase
MQVDTRGSGRHRAGPADRDHDDFAALRRKEYYRLDAAAHAYLDYTGAALHGASQIASHHRRMLAEVLGNPHSGNPASLESTARMERARARVLEFLHAHPDEYAVVFTANASGALRLIGESFPFRRGSRYLLTADNHNSVNGIRRFAAQAGAAVRYVPLEPDLRVPDPEPWLREDPPAGPSLFAFPAQSNFSGHRHPLSWVDRAHECGYDVLLDAAAFVPTSPLRLDAVRPDFVCLSFYKMFGYPTGIGALVARREALARLGRPWFAGGTVDWVSTRDETYALRACVEAFEDGTANFLAFDAVCDGLDLLDRIGMTRISARLERLTIRLLAALTELRHSDGSPMIELYGRADAADRGGTVSFNVVDATGRIVPFAHVIASAARARVSLRGGCFCNPGCAEAALRMPPDRTHACREALGAAYTPDRFERCLGSGAGAVRASLGVPTLARDIDRLIRVLEQYRGSTHPH